MTEQSIDGNWGARAWRALAVGTVLLLGSAVARAERNPEDQVERTFEKTVTLSGNQGLSLENRFGSVRVTGISGHDVKISAKIRVQGKSKEDAQGFADKIQIDVQQSGDGVHVKTIYPDEHSKYVFRIEWKKTSYSVDYDVTMPADASLWVRNDFGNTEISGVHGWAQAENGHGSVNVRDAGTVKITNSFGRIGLANATGNCTVVNNNGTVELSNIKGALEVRNRFGTITATQLGGPAIISGGNGTVEITNANANVTISNSFGTVTARSVNGNLSVRDNNSKVEAYDITGSAELATSFGEVLVERVGGVLNVEDNNGQVNANEIHGATSIKTSFGRINATRLYKGASLVTGNGNIVADGVDGDLFAKTSFGSVDVRNIKGKLTAQDQNGAVTANSIAGDAMVETSFGGVALNGIGGKIRVDNQNGAIEVTAASSGACKDIVLKTSFSHIVVRVPAASGYKVSARTSFGRISSELPITSTGTIGSDVLEGTIGNGACALGLSNSNGSIEIAKAP